MKNRFRNLVFLTALSLAATPMFADGPGTGDPPPPPPGGGTSTSSPSDGAKTGASRTTGTTAQAILALLELLGL
jgi:hypothetical protein